MMTPREGIVRAIALYGSQSELAEAIGYTSEAIRHAIKTGRTSVRMATNIEAVTRGQITRQILCPDVFAPSVKLLLNKGWVHTKRSKKRLRQHRSS